MTEAECGKILDTALDAGLLLLNSGAEMRRVEEVVVRMAASYGVNVKKSSYSVTNGLMVSYDDESAGIHLSKIRQVPPGISTRLDQMVLVNQLSRDVAEGKYSVEEAGEELERISAKKSLSLWIRFIFAGMASAAFVFLLGGGFTEVIPAFLGGALSYAFVSATGQKFSRMISNLFGGIIFALIALLWVLIFKNTPVSYEKILTGAMMPLIPGLSFTNGFRDFGNGDYLSGTVRLIDALVFFAVTAAGASMIFILARVFGLNVPENVAATGIDNFAFQLLMAFVGTISFVIMFELPWKFVFFGGLCGVISWGVYLLTYPMLGLAFATFLSIVAMCFVARVFSTVLRCPLTGFLVPGIIPIVPGSALFFMVFYLTAPSLRAAALKGLDALIICGALMLGIAVVNGIPQGFFKWFRKPFSK